ncbi:hypothetical protein PAAL109150_11455 [Paenibacillus alkaliterrae]
MTIFFYYMAVNLSLTLIIFLQKVPISGPSLGAVK